MLSEIGGTMVFGCAQVELTQPLVPGKSGKFTARGIFEMMGGPKRSDRLGDRARPTLFSGQARGDLIRLDLRIDGETAPRHFVFHRNQHAFLNACL